MYTPKLLKTFENALKARKLVHVGVHLEEHYKKEMENKSGNIKRRYTQAFQGSAQLGKLLRPYAPTIWGTSKSPTTQEIGPNDIAPQCDNGSAVRSNEALLLLQQYQAEAVIISGFSVSCCIGYTVKECKQRLNLDVFAAFEATDLDPDYFENPGNFPNEEWQTQIDDYLPMQSIEDCIKSL